MLLESSIMLQENIFCTGTSHDYQNIFIIQDTSSHLVSLTWDSFMKRFWSELTFIKSKTTLFMLTMKRLDVQSISSFITEEVLVKL
jgi:hypothetical protein